MGERKENCQRQSGMDCRGCAVAVDIARNVLSEPGEPVVQAIREIALDNCPEGTKFLLNGDLRELIGVEGKVIELEVEDGRPSADRKILGGAEAAL